ncbi:fibronectin type III domain-containing protein [Tenacibaculum sp.]|nr:fibronectin type III domain-containing protein [Tenacibaculum sp.]
MNILQRAILVFSIFFSTIIHAQTYPVQVNPQLVPPYSLKLSDYATTTSEKLYVNVLLTDVNEIGRRIRLKMFIEGQGISIATQDIIRGDTPIFVDGGVNLRLSNVDLKPYFQLNNLQGITAQQYNTPLPNGGYDFCFEVYDYFSNLKLSSKSCTTIYLLQNDPPILNLPFKDNIVNATNPQNILFTWTPRHSNVGNVQYEYTLKEIWDRQNPQASFLATPPFYQTTTHATTLLVGPEAPQLLQGKIYGWQVRAFVSDGINETSVFKNDGKSEIFWFKYLEDCASPSFVISQALNAESVRVNWQTSEHLKYQVQYRKKGFGDDDWFHVSSYTNEVTIHNLEPDNVYEFRVGGECTQLSGFAYSNIQEFTTPTNEEAAYYNCGLMPQINITNTDPLPTLGVNDTFTAGDFPVVTREVTGGNGVFSGWGYITLPFLENIKEVIDAVNIASQVLGSGEEDNINIGKYTRIKVKFSGVEINTDKQLTGGVVETEYDPSWKGMLDVDKVIDDIVGDDGKIAGYDADSIDIKEVKVDENGNVVLVPEEGEEQTIITDKPVVITDKKGDQWIVDEEGNVTKGAAAEGGTPNSNNTAGVSNSGSVKEISSKDVQVTFIPSGYYGTDQYNKKITSEKYKKKYEFIKTHDNKEYSVLYKLVSDIPPNTTDIVKAEVTFKNGKTKEDIVFKTAKGSKVITTWSGNVATLQLKRQFDFAKDEILATVKPKDSTKKYEVAGKLNTWQTKQRNINLTLVSVDGAPLTNVKERINEIYNKAGVNFTISEEDLTIGLSSLDVGDSDMISHYTDGEKAIISAFRKKGTKKDHYYMFFLNDNVELSKDLNGFMPLKRQFGFVFKTNDAGRVAAHELGHGIFGLKHPWNQYNDSDSEGKTDYLMDYGTGTALSHMDWQKLHAPGIQFYIFQGDKAGEFAGSYALSPNFEFVYINGTSTLYTKAAKKLITGTLPGFVMYDKVNKKNKYYNWDFGINKYVNKDDVKDIYHVTPRSELPNLKSTVNLLYNLNGTCGRKAYVKLNYNDISKHFKQITSVKLTNAQKANNLNTLISKFTKTRSLPIPCGKSSNKSYSWYEIPIDCFSEDIQVLVTEDVQKIHALVDEKEKDIVVKTINEINYKCVFNNVSSNVIEKLLEKLIKGTIKEEQERAIVKLLIFTGKENSQNLFDLLNKKNNLINLFSEIENEKFMFFGENNENKMLEVLGPYIKRLNKDSDKWIVVNGLIKSKYVDIKEENKKVFIHNIIASMTGYNKKENLNQVTELFISMLIEDSKKLTDYKVVFDLAIDRLENKEAFSSFTQGNKLQVKIPGVIFDTTCSISDSGVDRSWSWIKPGGFDLTCSNGGLKQFRYSDYTEVAGNKNYRLNDVFVWSKYYWENREKMSDLFSNNLVEYLRIFKEQLNLHLKSVEKVNESFWDNKEVTCNDLKDIFNQININESSSSLKKVLKEKRVLVLKKYFECDNDIVSINFEEIDITILKLLTSFDIEDNSILLELEQIGIEKVFKKLTNKESSKTLAKVLVWMGGQIHNSGHFIGLEKDMLLNKDGEVVDKNKLLGLETNIFDFTNEIENFESILSNNKFKVKDKIYDYNQKVAVYVADKFEFLGQKFKKGDVLVMPMIQAYAMSNSNISIVNDKVVWLTVDGALLVVGIGEVAVFFKAGNLLRKAIVTVDLASSAAGMIENIVDSSSLSEKARFNLQMFALITSIPSLTTSLKKMDNLVSKFDGEIDAMRNLDEKASLISYVEKLKSRIDLYSSFTSLLNKNDLLEKFNNLSSSLKRMFKKDFLEKPSEKVLNALKNNEAFNFWKKYRSNNPEKVLCK